MFQLGIDTQIPLAVLLLKNNGDANTGRIVYVEVYNAITGAQLLAPTLMTEFTVRGIYRYLWTHGLTARTWLRVVYRLGSSTSTHITSERILFEDTISRMDQADGRAI